MQVLKRFLGISWMALGFALIQGPALLQAQTAEERAREQEVRQKIEEHLQRIQKERQLRMEEVLAQAKERLAEAEVRHRDFDAARAEHIERALAEAQARAERGHEMQELALARQLEAQAEVLARVEEGRFRQEDARKHYQELETQYREQTARAMDRARERLRETQQVMVRVRARVRLGVSLDGNQGDEFDAQGARVTDVMEDTPAEEAGLQEGDIITHLNGRSLLVPIPNESEQDFDEDESLPVQRLISLAQELDPGDEVEVRYLRSGTPESVSFEAAEIDEPSVLVWRGPGGEDVDMRGVFRFDPDEEGVWTFDFPDEKIIELKMDELKKLEEMGDLEVKFKDLQVDMPDIHWRAFPEGNRGYYSFRGGDAPSVVSFFGDRAGAFGLELTKMNPGLAEYFSSQDGVLVLKVDEDSTLGLMAGDVILAIDARDIEDEGDVARILGSYEDDERVSFTVIRKGSEIRVEGTVG